jgi:hypothetical protein
VHLRCLSGIEHRPLTFLVLEGKQPAGSLISGVPSLTFSSCEDVVCGCGFLCKEKYGKNG